jgi:hypothetical protein
MSNFDYLTLAFEDWFDKPLCDLPAALKQRIEKDFCLFPWDHLSVAGRRAVVQEWDYQNDPATKKERLDSWDNAKRELDINAQIAIWEAISTPTALDLAEKENRLAGLRQELAASNANGLAEVDPIDTSTNTAQPKKMRMLGDDLQVTGASNASVKRQGSITRNDVRKFATQAMYKKWQKAYQAVTKRHPNMSDVWYSQQIAKTPIAQRRRADTIKKHMKP